MSIPGGVRFDDMLRLWRWRTWLLAVQCVVQGAQYVYAPTRALQSPAYRLLVPIGQGGWRVAGLLFVAGGLALALARSGRIPTPRWVWIAAFTSTGLLYAFLACATLLNHLYLPSTLILPLGLCLAEVDLIGRIRQRRPSPRES